MPSLRSLSPIPPMSRSNPSSPNPNHRLSTSSNRSLRKSEADFEAALRDTGATLFLSAGPAAIGEEPETESASGASEATPGIDAVSMMDSPIYRSEPEQERSYEDDFKELGRKTQDERVGLGVGSLGIGSPVRGTIPTPGVIPPTPTGGHMRTGSMMTTSSAASTGTGDTQSRHARKVSKSLGIDAELGIEPKQKLKKTPPKRRNMFRSAGTSSQPDLASIVRRSTNERPNHDPPPSAGPTTTTSPVSQMTPSTSSRTLYQSPRGVSSPPRAAGTAQGSKKESMDMYGSMMGGNKMATIVEGQGTLNRNRSNTSDEGFKSMRNKAKGMFGKMFGSSKDTRPSNHSASASSSRIDIHEMPAQSVPPVPAVPSAYVQQKPRVFNSPPTAHPDVFGPADDNTADRFTLGSPVLPQKKTPPSSRPGSVGIAGGRVSITPTTERRESGASALSTDKPLPAVRVTDQGALPAPTEKKSRSSLHVRQPANASEEETTPVRTSSSRKPAPSPATAAVSSFSADMAGMLANIGQSEPARELGLPPSSMRKKENGRGKFPADLSRTASQESPPATGPQRSASLPANNLAKQEPSSPQRASTSHIPSYLATAGKAQASQFSRSRAASQTSGIRLETQMEGSEGSLLSARPSTAPQISPIFGENKRLGHQSSGLVPASVKLVSQANDALETPAKDSPKSSPPTAWGRQSPGTSVPESSDPELVRPQSNSGSVPSERAKHDDGDVEMMASPPRTPSRADTVNTEATENAEELEEKGRRLACEFLDEDTTNVAGDKVAEFLGGPRPVNTIALKYYMQYFDMKGQNLVEAFRDLCQKLYLKAESQEIDRIIEAFSARYFECNPNTTFGSPGVVHTVAAAMLMLNTDLHIAELQKHMSKSDFVRNAMRAIQMSNGASEDRSSTPDLITDDGENQPPSLSSSTSTNYVGSVRAKIPTSGAHRSASAPVVTSPPPHHRADSSASVVGSAVSPSESKLRSSSTTVSSGSFNYGKTWESETEGALKEIYASVRADRILLPTAAAWDSDRNVSGNKRQSMISIASNGPYDRASRVRSPSDRVNVLKRGSIRSVQGFLGSNSPYSSQWYSSEGRLSPAPSYATSTNEISSPSSAFAPALGFASNLSHTVIRENDGDDTHSVHSHASVGTIEEMDDDELALLGAPWAKEGILQRKVQSEGVAKRVKKSGDWKQYFVVASKGDVFMFTFGDGKGGGSMSMGGSVGGGNWLENANANGKIPLMHTTSAILPKPGYSSSRPYCFSLTEPSGEVSFFQAGTEDLVAEWVATCNYWAARKSRQPLQGGVSNMEYGWNKVGLDDQDDRMSIMSHRSNMSRLGGTYGRRLGSSSGGGGNDKIFINDWKPPPAASVPSPLEEEAQLEALVAYVKLQEKELERHKAVEEPMLRLYSFGSKNLAKAKDNWRAKSHYIHTEIFKYETYIDALRRAIHLRVKKSGEKKLEKSLNSSIHGLHAVAEGKTSPLVGASEKSEDEEEEDQFEDAAAELGKKPLTIDPAAGRDDDGEEEQPITPGATLRGR